RDRRRVVVRAFAARPAVVLPPAAGGLVIEFLPGGVANVADHQRARAAARGIVEAALPGVAETDVPDLRRGAGRKRIVRRDGATGRIAVWHRYVDSQHLSQQAGHDLGVRGGRTAVAGRRVEIAVRTELQGAAVMVARRLMTDKAGTRRPL